MDRTPREVRLRFRAPEQVEIAASAVEKLCQGLDVAEEARELLRIRTVAALHGFVGELSDPCRADGTIDPVELVIDVEEGQLRLTLYSSRPGDAGPFRLVVPVTATD